MTNQISILLPSKDAEELMQLLGRDDIPVDHWRLADTVVDRLDAALESAKPRERRPRPA